MGGLLPAAPAPLACALPCAPRSVSDDGVGAVEVALLSAGADAEGVDDATMLPVVDVAAGSVVVMGVDEATELVDVAATCARTGPTMENAMASAKKTALVPTNLVIVFFITLLLS